MNQRYRRYSSTEFKCSQHPCPRPFDLVSAAQTQTQQWLAACDEITNRTYLIQTDGQVDAIIGMATTATKVDDEVAKAA